MSLAWMRSRTVVHALALISFSLLAAHDRADAVEPVVARTDAAAESSAAAPAAAATPTSGEPLWIWSPTQSEGAIPKGTVYFRKTFNSSKPEQGMLHITCDDAYEVYLNGRLVGKGTDWKHFQAFNLLPFLIEGKNLICVKRKTPTEPPQVSSGGSSCRKRAARPSPL